MNTFTHPERPSTLAPSDEFCPSRPGWEETTLQPFDMKEEETPSVRQMLDRLKFSPRTATLLAILEYARKAEKAI
ncbi:hypothetical protein [Compostibacter hankyongensis]|uniref:Uncharacterized protein n=1 Tax=Compostibacter hankyongensis TaxID=1007089 RepID=A0ABP8FFD1_9BACT